jgi:tRNA(Ile)-lysidine synthase
MSLLRSVAWSARAAALAAALPRSRLHPAVLAWSASRRAAARGPWAVALSGGADSIALLLLLWARWPERRARLVALHFNHRLRGAASDGDAKFCRRVCRALRVKLRVGRWHGARAGASEAAARTARLAFFDQAMSAVGASALWLGHQQDDVAETFFMRLARGSGAAGLAAPRPVQPMPGGGVRLRPLLTLKKAEISTALRAAGIPWREDASNAGDDYFRNRIRRAVLPAWQRAAHGRDALEGAALARELLDEDDAALEAWLDELRPLQRGAVLNLAVLAGKPRALWRRALRRWLGATPYHGDLSRQGFATLLAAAMRGRRTRHSLGREGFAVIRPGRLCYKKTRSPSPPK